MSLRLFQGDILRKELITFLAVMYEQGAEIVPVSEEPDKCLAERKISRREQLYWTLSAKDSLFLRLVDDV